MESSYWKELLNTIKDIQSKLKKEKVEYTLQKENRNDLNHFIKSSFISKQLFKK